jgi:hypothetical protein
MIVNLGFGHIACIERLDKCFEFLLVLLTAITFMLVLSVVAVAGHVNS